MSKPLRVLVVEDSAEDAELLLEELRRGGYEVSFERVDATAAMTAALTGAEWDIVISDYSMPDFSAPAALELLQKSGFDLPFIIVSGVIGEEVAVEAMKAGAQDCIMKYNLKRLLPAVERELREAGVRREGKRAEEALKLFRTLIDRSNDAIEVVDPETGRFLDINEKAWQDLGYSREELLSLSVSDIDPTVDPPSFPRIMEDLRKSGFIIWEGYHRRKDGSTFPVEVNIKYVRLDRDYAVTVVRDITERKRTEEALVRSEERFRQIAESIREVFWMTDPKKKEILYVSPGYEKIWGRTCESLYERPAEWLAAIHPEDRERVVKAAMEKQAKGTYDEEYRILRPDGSLRWIRDRAFPVRNESGEVYRVTGIAEDITLRREAEDMVQHLAYYDALTGLPNRNTLYNRLLSFIRTDTGGDKRMGLLLLDLNHFKEINDTLGHDRGDEILQQVGRRLRAAMFERDVVARPGGDEFSILIVDLAGAKDIDVAVEKIVKALDPPFIIDNLPIRIEASIGVALYPDHGDVAETLYRRADIAMHVSKKGGVSYIVYDPAQDKHSPQRLALMGELHYAIDHNELLLFYQPKINLKTRQTIGVEGLVRWKHPHRGMIPPDQFILPAEQTGLIHPLTRWVMAAGMRQCKAWREAGMALTVSVNLSARNLSDEKLPGQVAERLRETGISPDWMTFEITESAIMADPAHALEILNQLHEMGVRLSIDDFGIGYSSLAYLKKLPVDSIKIDKSFVINMIKNLNDAVIVRSTIELGHNMGLKVVAEGVENQDLWDRLSALGCDEAQGYYMARPMPADELTRWLRESPMGLKGS
jgi:diguanylate cyclase (GGDEF)-like protein/PAS domain S-box-containing protein